MAEQTSTSNMLPDKTEKPTYPRSGWILWMRTVLLFRWQVPLVALILYVLFNLIRLVVQNHNDLSSLLSIDKDMTAFVVPIEHLFISIVVLILLGVFVFGGYRAKADEEREDLFIDKVRAEKQREAEEKQREAEEKQREAEEKQPPPIGFKLRHTLTGHTKTVSDVAWSPDGKMLASSGRDKTIRLWDPQSGASLRELIGHTDSVYNVAWSPDGKMLASSGADKTIRLWDPQSGAFLRELTGHTDSVYNVA